MSKSEYRPGVVAVVQNDNGEILLLERSDVRNSWQFPQGGIEDGEAPEHALFRELMEEIGENSVTILLQGQGTTRYEWPRGGKGRLGQEHFWFLVKFNNGAEPQLDRGDGSFRSWKWENPSAALGQIVDWKQPAFRAGLEMLGLL